MLAFALFLRTTRAHRGWPAVSFFLLETPSTCLHRDPPPPTLFRLYPLRRNLLERVLPHHRKTLLPDACDPLQRPTPRPLPAVAELPSPEVQVLNGASSWYLRSTFLRWKSLETRRPPPPPDEKQQDQLQLPRKAQLLLPPPLPLRQSRGRPRPRLPLLLRRSRRPGKILGPAMGRIPGPRQPTMSS